MIETFRLRLRAAHEHDVPGLMTGLNDWEVAQWVVRPPFPYSEQDARQFIDWTRIADKSGFEGKYVIADRRNDRLLGVVSLEPSGRTAELGYWLLPSAQGRGYMTEATMAVLTKGARELINIEVVFATVDPANSASQGVLKRLGLRLIGERSTQTSRRGSPKVLIYEARLDAFASAKHPVGA